ncbi:CAP domain-containing protein [Alloacidobacterium dinghuense]|uniref:CAP domain-containing protein n=1 Tax=Alloacidobacterium dinghuense TaxID=2763107 RepID=A0A7G8BMS9_9BACT|nr:CAP domain-containing protein [Alloacidobacterium dinghuense]QNI33849.1 CAP domain-containing protein [Alloacidobacterium dinghuense]
MHQSPVIMRVRHFILLVLLAVITTQAQQLPNDQQQKLLNLTNQARTDQGLQPLHWDPSLAAAAQAHAQKMFDQRSLSHQLPGEPDLRARAAQAGAHFREVAENVAMGNGAEGVQKEWMNSPPHRANILDPKLTDIGIGVVEHAGYWYAVVDFDSAVQNMDSNQIEQKVAALVRDRGVDPSRPPDAARKDCAVEEGDVSGTHALFVMRWESSSLDRLPAPLEQRLATGRYKIASVGACGGQQAANQGFTTYRLAVLLY